MFRFATPRNRQKLVLTGNNRPPAVLPSMGTGISYDTAIRHEKIRPLAVAPDIEDTLDDFAVSKYLQVPERRDKGWWSAV
jgi:hypothetical protein